jgi:hypothetical protein
LHWFSTLILRLLSTRDHSRVAIFIFFFHIRIKYFSFFKYFHQFGIDFITIKLFQNIFLMIKLILRLLRLFSSLLLLNQCISIFWRRCFFNILPVRLSSTFWLLYLLGLLLTVSFFGGLFVFAELVFVIDDMHRQTLVW